MQTYPPGTRIGQYEIASLPMMGGMGVVYFALDHGNDGRPVALKTFRPELLPDRAARDRFLREGTAWIELGSHPHVVRCYKVEYIAPTAFLVLELIAKEQNMPDASLRSWLIPGRPLPLEQALLFALQIARGMQYATEKIPGFVHRDLKPENILVGVDRLPGTNINRLRVTDFGLVKTIADSKKTVTIDNEEELKPNQVQFTRGAGTPLYMAPEQWKGEPVGMFTDIYALGCILYEMISGLSSAQGKTIPELEMSHCDRKLRPIPVHWTNDLRTLVTKCLMFNPTNRYGNWREIIESLEHIYSVYNRQSIPQQMQMITMSGTEKLENGWSFNEIGRAYGEISKADISIRYFERALEVGRSEKAKELIIAALSNLGGAHDDIGEYQQAIRYYEQAMLLANEINARDRKSRVLGKLGLAYGSLGNLQLAVKYHRQHLEIARELNDREGESVALGNLGIVQAQLEDTKQATNYFRQALTIYHEMGDMRGTGSMLNNLGLMYAREGNTQTAIEHYLQYLDLARAIGDRHGEGIALSNIGNSYRDLGNVQRAIDYHKKSLAVSLEINDRHGACSSLGNLAISYANFGNTDQAITYCKQQLQVAQKMGYRPKEGDALSNLGSVYFKIGDMQGAMQYYQQSLDIHREVGSVSDIATVCFNLAVIHERLDDVAKALPYAKEALQIWSRIQSPRTQQAEELVNELQGVESNMDSHAILENLDNLLEAFLETDSLDAMPQLINDFPKLKDPFVIQLFREAINDLASEDRQEIEKRLAWLVQINDKS